MNHHSLFRSAAAVLLGLALAALHSGPALAQILGNSGDPFVSANNVLNSASSGARLITNSLAFFGFLGAAIAMVFGKGKIPGTWLACIIGACLLIAIAPTAISWVQNQVGGGGLGGILQ